ncbi:hypothetical protein [Rhodopila sp.]
MTALQTGWRWLPFGLGLVAGLVLAELMNMMVAYPTPVVDLLQALDFALL